MPSWIPLGSLLFAGGVALAVVPIRRPRRLRTLSWMLTMVPNEVPQLFALLLVASWAPTVATDGLTSARDWVGLTIAVATGVGLAVVAGRAERAQPALERALDEGLGGGWRTELPAVRRRSWWRTLLMPWPRRPAEVELVSDIQYGPDPRFNVLDVYRHRSRPERAPTLIHFHGGRFRWGHKSREARPLLHRLASQGWTCISADYHLSRSPGAGFPEHLIDAKRVIAWVRREGADHGVDAGTLFVAGSSAGSHLATLAALTPNDPAFQPGFEADDTSITAAIGLYGYYGRLDSSDPATSPIDRVHQVPSPPPCFLVHGTNDTYTPIDSARALATGWHDRAGGPVVLAEVPGAQHSFDVFHSRRFEAVIDAIEAFAAEVTSRRGAGTSTPTATSERPTARADAPARWRRHAHVLLPALLLGGVTAACGDDDIPVSSATTTTTEPSASTTTIEPRETTTTTETVDTTSPASVADAVATAWAEGDEAAVRANADPVAADLLLALDPGDGPWSEDDCEGAAGSTYCEFDAPDAALTFRVANPGPTASTAPSVAGVTFTTAGDAVALWPLTTAAEAQNTQHSVDEGHSPWHLDPHAVALSFADAELGYVEPAVDAASSEGETIRVTDATGRSVDIAATQPARTGPGGIWAVTAVLTAE